MGWVYIIITAVMDVASSVFIKEWTLHGKILDLALGIALLVCAGVSFALSMKFFGLAISNVLWNSLSTVILAAIAIAFFHEKLSAIQIAGILITVLGVALVGK
ncbi:MAG: SMR family transporter [Patescibacteria group bacterium]|nr:SMR family transporter [Patescibacteria group bacterium]